MADSVVNHYVVNRIDSESQCDNAVAACNGLEVLRVAVGSGGRVFSDDSETVLDIDIALANLVSQTYVVNVIDDEIEVYSTVAAVDSEEVLRVWACYRFVESVLFVCLTLTDSGGDVSDSSRVDDEVEGDNAVAALSSRQVLSVSSICRFVESV